MTGRCCGDGPTLGRNLTLALTILPLMTGICLAQPPEVVPPDDLQIGPDPVRAALRTLVFHGIGPGTPVPIDVDKHRAWRRPLRTVAMPGITRADYRIEPWRQVSVYSAAGKIFCIELHSPSPDYSPAQIAKAFQLGELKRLAKDQEVASAGTRLTYACDSAYALAFFRRIGERTIFERLHFYQPSLTYVVLLREECRYAAVERVCRQLPPSDDNNQVLAKEVELGIALHYLGRKGEASRWIDELISRWEKAHAESTATDESLAAAYQIRAVFLWQTQQYDTLEQWGRHMQTRFPNSKGAEVSGSLLARLYAGRGEMAKYEPLARQRLKQDSGNVVAQNDLAETLAEQGKDLENALLLARSCVRQEPDNIAYLDTLAWTLFKLGRYDEALTYHQRACKGDQPEAVALMRMGDCLLKLGRRAEARKAWERGRERLQSKACPDIFDARVLADLRRRLAAEGVE